VKEAWWRDMVSGHDDLSCLSGAPAPYEMAGLDCTIIMHPQVWKVSGHYDLFHDFMVDCRETKARLRADHLQCIPVVAQGESPEQREMLGFVATVNADSEALASKSFRKRMEKAFGRSR